MVLLDSLVEVEIILFYTVFQLFKHVLQSCQVFLQLVCSILAGLGTPIFNGVLLVLSVLLWIFDLDWFKETKVVHFPCDSPVLL